MKIVACTNDIDGNADTDIDNDDYAEIDSTEDINNAMQLMILRMTMTMMMQLMILRMTIMMMIMKH